MSANQVVAEVEAGKRRGRTANDSENMKANDMTPSPGVTVADEVVIPSQHNPKSEKVTLTIVDN